MKSNRTLICARVGVVVTLLLLFAGMAVSAQGQTLTMATNKLSFNPTFVGSSSSTVLGLSNTGTAALTISSITSSGTPFSQTNTCGTGLAPGGKCVVTMTFAPTVLGTQSGTITIADDAANSPQTIGLVGSGVPPAHASVSSVAFGSRTMNTTSTPTAVTITNSETTPLDITGITTTGDFASTNTCLATLPGSGTCTVNLTFTPTALGSRTGTLSVSTSVGYTFSVTLSGGGTAPYTVTPTALAFGNQATGTSSAAKTVTLTNLQNVALGISSAAVSAGFVQTNTCGSSLAASSSCSFSVAFAPAALGGTSGSLTLVAGNTPSPQTISLSGTGIVPYTVTPTTLAFGNLATGTTSAPKTVTVTNSQNVPLAISAVAVSAGFAQTNNCGSVAANGSCSFSVTFAPTATGSAAGSLTFAASNGVSPQTISLTGTGTVPYTVTPTTLAFGNQTTGASSAAKTVTVTNNQNVALGITSVAVSAGFAQTNTCGSSVPVNGSCIFSVTFGPTAIGSATGNLTFATSNGSAQTITLSGTGVTPVTVSRTSIMFSPQAGGTAFGSQLAAVTVKNNQNVALGITGVAITANFQQTNTCGTSVAAGGSCVITVGFAPAALGVLTGTLTISDDVPALPQTVVTLQGTALPPMALSTATVSFGSQATGGATAAQNILVKNNSTAAFTLTAIAVTGDYQQTNNCPATLAAGTNCSVSVVFAPAATGARNGTLTVTNSSLSSPLTANLYGTGTAGLVSIAVTPATSSWGVGGVQQYAATGTYSDKSAKDLTSSVIWTSGNSAVGINAAGAATVMTAPDVAVAITATSGGIVSAPAWLNALSTLPRVCPTPNIDMKLLVVTNGQTEADFPAIKQILDYLGTPYTVFDMSVNTGGITADMLSDSGCHGYYQGVIFTYGSYIYTLPGMPTLTSYEQTFGVRQVNWFTYPGTDFGMNTATSTVSSNSTYSASFTAAGAQVFTYANTGTPLAIANAAVYLATATTGSASTSLSTGGTTLNGHPIGTNVTPLLVDSTGHALSVVYDFGDGRQYLSQTFDSNAYLTHNLVLAYGLVNWVTKGIFLGEYHVYASASVDDFFIGDAEWVPGTPCTNAITHDRTASDDPSLPTYRLHAADMTSLVNWQNNLNQDPLLSSFKLSLAFNGVGTAGNKDWTGLPVSGIANDDLVTGFPNYQQYFHWMSHTYDHPETLDGLTKSGPADVNGDTIDLEILTNLWVAKAAGGVNLDADRADSALAQLTFTDFDPHSIVTPGVTGLDDPNVSPYLYQDGVFYVVSDTSVTPTATNNNGPNPTPNVGIVNSYAPGIYEVPRHANDVYFNAANWNDDAAEFHCIYGPEGSNQTPYSNFTSAQILDFVSTSFVNNMLLGDMDPQMFHQPNLGAYDGTHSLISDTYDMTFSKYKALYKLPVLSPTQAQTAQLMQTRNLYNLSGVSATLVGGTTPTIVINMPANAAVTSATIPVTGLNSTGAEVYGGQYISHIAATAGTPITLLIQ